jgi:hypothetical protein
MEWIIPTTIVFVIVAATAACLWITGQFRRKDSDGDS